MTNVAQSGDFMAIITQCVQKQIRDSPLTKTFCQF